MKSKSESYRFIGGLTYGVGLLGFDADLLKNDALGVGRTTEGAISSTLAPVSISMNKFGIRCAPGLESSAESTLLVGQIGPPLLAAVVAQLARGVETTRLSTGHFG